MTETRRLIQKKLDPVDQELLDLIDKEVDAMLESISSDQRKPMDVCRSLFSRALLTANGIKVATTDTKKLLQICVTCRTALINTGNSEYIPITLKRSRHYVFIFFDTLGQMLDQAGGAGPADPEGILPDPGLQRDRSRPGEEARSGDQEAYRAETIGSGANPSDQLGDA